ncbi:MAG: hypothetical protein J7513_11415 [Solirubrobacteraceae bacterium]|nr:hypothetical protein [Solirubrobacteraceae bacterium]
MAEDRALAVLDAVVGVSAIGGATYAVGGAPQWPREWLEGSPFRSYLVPGLVLGLVHAPLDLAAGYALWRRRPEATALALTSGAVQVGWIATQYRIIGLRSFLQPLLGVVGVVSLALAVRRARREGCDRQRAA